MRVLPLHEAHAARGAVFAEEHGWRLPAHYGDPEGEYWAAAEGVGLVDASARAVLRVAGDGATSFLQAVVTNDVVAVRPGEGCAAALLSARGGMVADLLLARGDGEFLVAADLSLRETLAGLLRRVAVGRAVAVTALHETHGVLALHGPGAPVAAARWGKDLEALPEYGWRRMGSDGAWGVFRQSLTGSPGYHRLTPLPKLREEWEGLIGQGLRPVGEQAMEALRIEAGIPRFGRDLDGTTLPLEARLDHAISYTKGCYVGQEVIARLTYRGHVTRRLVGLQLLGRLPGDAVVPAGGAIVVSGERVGAVTSFALSPWRGGVGLGYVRADLLPGIRVQLRVTEGLLDAAITPLPFPRVPCPGRPS